MDLGVFRFFKSMFYHSQYNAGKKLEFLPSRGCSTT